MIIAGFGDATAVAAMQVSLGSLGYKVTSTGSVNMATISALSDVAGQLDLPKALKDTLASAAFVASVNQDKISAYIEGNAELIANALAALLAKKSATPSIPSSSTLSPFELLLQQQDKSLPTYKPPVASIPEPLVIQKRGFWRLDNVGMWALFAAGAIGIGAGVYAFKGR